MMRGALAGGALGEVTRPRFSKIMAEQFNLESYIARIAEETARRVVREELAQQPPPPAPDERALSEQEFCARAGISERTAQRLRASGKLRCKRVGRRVLYLPEHISEFLTENRKRGKVN